VQAVEQHGGNLDIMQVPVLVVNEVFSGTDTGLCEMIRFLHEVHVLSNFHVLRKIRSEMRGGFAADVSFPVCDVKLG
jgi:hypothetical protein